MSVANEEGVSAAFHRHAAAAAAANPPGKGRNVAQLAYRSYNGLLITGNSNLASERQCHCRQCRQPGHLPLTNWQQRPSMG
ncbi:MAG: hypothetical protein JNJ78_01435 [Anaerolineae bacterium]|nr:hypothetical protein [Anaerolineae bacterium]